MLTIILFIFGSVIGSFLNVVAIRTVNGEELVRKRSYCRGCKKTLAWYELVPVLSWIFLSGRCRRCQVGISPQYPVIEMITGTCAAILLAPTPTPAGVLLFICACLLLVLALIDQRTMLLPDKFIILLLAASLGYLTTQEPLIWRSALIATLVGTGFMVLIWLITRGQGIGLGDVKLMVPISIILGSQGVITALFISFLAGGIYGLYLLITKQATPKTAVAFGPFLAGAALVCLVLPEISQQFITFLGWPLT
jgi:prepilin signal peptidase PulO-like enzyme (type II secretory pathway)